MALTTPPPASFMRQPKYSRKYINAQAMSNAFTNTITARRGVNRRFMSKPTMSR
jgi:hypothetical protein